MGATIPGGTARSSNTLAMELRRAEDLLKLANRMLTFYMEAIAAREKQPVITAINKTIGAANMFGIRWTPVEAVDALILVLGGKSEKQIQQTITEELEGRSLGITYLDQFLKILLTGYKPE